MSRRACRRWPSQAGHNTFWLSGRAVALCVVGACGGDDHGSGDAELEALRERCREGVTAEAQRFETCFGPNEELLEAALGRCDQLSAQELSSPITDAFNAALDNCQDTLECDELGEGDEICVPIALEEIAPDSVPNELVTSCIASSDVDVCADAVAGISLPDLEASGAIGHCLQRWVSCRDELAGTEPYWTKNHCTTLVALGSEAQASADTCLQASCDETAACLVEAGSFDP
jgi:hypothetical protein